MCHIRVLYERHVCPVFNCFMTEDSCSIICFALTLNDGSCFTFQSITSEEKKEVIVFLRGESGREETHILKKSWFCPKLEIYWCIKCIVSKYTVKTNRTYKIEVALDSLPSNQVDLHDLHYSGSRDPKMIILDKKGNPLTKWPGRYNCILFIVLCHWIDIG